MKGPYNSVADGRVSNFFGAFIFSLTRPRIAPSLDKHFYVMLPSRARGKELLDYYFTQVSWIYQVIHVPTVERQFNNLYLQLEQNQQPDYGHLALISSLFSLSAYFSSPSSGLFTDIPDQIANSRRWVLLAQDALSAADCLATPTLETLQCLVLVAQHLMPNIGAIATFRTLTATIVHTARALSLHQTDSATNIKRRANTKVDWVELEIKRRIWWHVTSTDWILSFLSGSQCGTYMISPKQMNVNYPSNVDDIAIPSPSINADYAQPMGQMTEMTYFILRIRFSVALRAIVDSAWDANCDLDDMPYEVVLESDKRLNDLLSELETAFKDLKSSTFEPGDPTDDTPAAKKYSLLQRQHDMCLFGIHTRFTRLHRAYLLRGAADPKYAYSRMICLRSARTVVEIGRAMTLTRRDITSIKIWTLNHHLFVSCVILVMDYCFNREEPRAKERKEEILDCFRLLESSKQECTIATRGLAKLRHMLRKEHPGEEPEGSRPSSSDRVEVGVVPPQARPSSAPKNQEVLPAQHLSMPGTSCIAPQPQIQDENFNINTSSFDNPPPYQWEEWDYSSLGNINFDVNLDASEFEALFMEGSNMMF